MTTSLDSFSPITGHAAGVPFVALPPAGGRRDGAPVVVAWHPQDAPRTEAAFASAIPLAGLDAWRIYFGLPLNGSRLPAGGVDEVLRMGYEDAVLNLFGPIVDGAAGEFGAAFSALADQLSLTPGPVGLMGGSIGAAVAQAVVADGGHGLDVRAAALLSPVIQLRLTVHANERVYDVTYPWSDASTAVADRLDFVARAGELAGTAILAVVGGDDDPTFCDAAGRLVAALRDAGTPAELVVVPRMGHALAEEPGTRPAPQTAHARIVDGHAAAWFARYLTDSA